MKAAGNLRLAPIEVRLEILQSMARAINHREYQRWLADKCFQDERVGSPQVS